ncbi:hypothetical protein [Nocardia jejuensis]|uniref:hypothetical protein n=1 Tax=Nocardia jejuensis TaxID=328049 RepID=UPI00082A1CEB|nr:hypothetical protein [Nocardia jejuensis]
MDVAGEVKTLPSEVSEPLMTLLGYLLWMADFLCLIWLIVGACRYFALKHSTVETYAEAHNGIGRTLIAAVLATVSMTVAATVLTQV